VSISEILSSTTFQMSLLLFVAFAGYLISHRVNQSAIVGIIIMGIIVGPSLLGWIKYTDFVSTMAHIGAIVLLFTVGLEFQIKEITKLKYLFIALLGVLVPWLCGYLVAIAFNFEFKAAVFIGTALTATSIAITANVLSELGKLQTEAAKAIIAAAVIDDILGLMALSVSEGIVSGDLSVGLLLITLAKAIGFVVGGGFLGLFVFRKLLYRLDGAKVCHTYPESAFIFAIMVAFFYAMAAEFVGLSAIVGSFLAGASFAGLKLERGKIFKEGAHHLQIIFASIFFISLGIIMDLHEFSADLLIFTLVLTLVAFFTKLVGCGFAAKLSGYKWKDSLAIGTGMAPRGEVAMIIALIGLNQGLVTQGEYTSIILMSLLTTIVLPFILKGLIFRQEHKARSQKPKILV
jgi:Kef-type K+ transport system membrane component KefB